MHLVDLDIRGSALPSAAKRSHYQSKMFVCVSTYCADAVDRLLFVKIVERSWQFDSGSFAGSLHFRSNVV